MGLNLSWIPAVQDKFLFILTQHFLLTLIGISQGCVAAGYTGCCADGECRAASGCYCDISCFITDTCCQDIEAAGCHSKSYSRSIALYLHHSLAVVAACMMLSLHAHSRKWRDSYFLYNYYKGIAWHSGIKLNTMSRCICRQLLSPKHLPVLNLWAWWICMHAYMQ